MIGGSDWPALGRFPGHFGAAAILRVVFLDACARMKILAETETACNDSN